MQGTERAASCMTCTTTFFQAYHSFCGGGRCILRSPKPFSAITAANSNCQLKNWAVFVGLLETGGFLLQFCEGKCLWIVLRVTGVAQPLRKAASSDQVRREVHGGQSVVIGGWNLELYQCCHQQCIMETLDVSNSSRTLCVVVHQQHAIAVREWRNHGYWKAETKINKLKAFGCSFKVYSWLQIAAGNEDCYYENVKAGNELLVDHMTELFYPYARAENFYKQHKTNTKPETSLKVSKTFLLQHFSGFAGSTPC